MARLSSLPSIATNQDSDDFTQSKESTMVISRREFWNRLSTTCTVATILSAAVLTGKPLVVRAACLYGDTSSDCIGVYKVPMDEEFMPFMDTPEKLKTFAPDIRWVPQTVPPKSYGDALKLMREMRGKCEALNDIVLKGELEEAGVNLLDIIPKVTVSGRVILTTLQAAAQQQQRQQDGEQPLQKASGNKARPRWPLENISMKSYRAETAHTELLATLGQCDVLIGQARSGQLGALTLAQIHILADIREALEQFDEMLRAIPETV